MANGGAIEIYSTKEGQSNIEVRLQERTVWLSQKLMSELFEKDSDTIGIHVKNIFSEGELEEKGTTELFSVVQKEGARNVNRNVKFYNLDVIISVGYRVNSKRGTQFRQWATQRLKDYLVKGYALNQKRLEELQQTIQLISQSSNIENLQLREAKGLLEIIQNYSQSFILLNQYDSHNLKAGKLTENITYEIKYEEAIIAIDELKKQLIAKKEATWLFGNPKDESFKGILGNIIQTFGKQYLCPSIEEQAANLLYFIIKIIHSMMEINALVHLCLCGSWKNTNIVLRKTGN